MVDYGYKQSQMNKIIGKVAKKNKLRTAKRPSFAKEKSIILPDNLTVGISQKQVLVNNGRGIMGGSSYEFRNSFSIVKDFMVIEENISLNQLESRLNSQIKQELNHIDLIKRYG